MTTAVFLDRDGTLNEEVGYIQDVNNLKLISGAARAVSRLNNENIVVILTTNQSGAARGLYDENHILHLNQHLADLLQAERGAWLDAVFYCPHLPEATVETFREDCNCRKPKTGMIQNALTLFPQIELSQSFVVGDKASDVEFAKNAGCKGILLRTGYGEKVLRGEYQELTSKPDWVCRDIVEAVDRILGKPPHGRS